MSLDLGPICKRWSAGTPGPWYWNSYDQISAEVEPGHPLDCNPGDPRLNVNGKKIAVIAWIEGGPAQRGQGDDLVEPEARANAEKITHAPTDLAALVAEVERLRAALAEYADKANWGADPESAQQQLIVWCHNWEEAEQGPDLARAALEPPQ